MLGNIVNYEFLLSITHYKQNKHRLAEVNQGSVFKIASILEALISAYQHYQNASIMMLPATKNPGN